MLAWHGPVVVELPDGTKLAVVISWRCFRRAPCEGVKAGAEAILNPTNGSSYTAPSCRPNRWRRAFAPWRTVGGGRPPDRVHRGVDADGTVSSTSISEQRVVYAIELRTGRTGTPTSATV
jgi:hypothetical protein